MLKRDATGHSHTPGPWRCREYEDGAVVQRGDEGGFVVRGRDRSREKADARLIAAAPDLLAALVALQKEWHHTIGNCSSKSAHALNAMAEAAIKKARGE